MAPEAPCVGSATPVPCGSTARTGRVVQSGAKPWCCFGKHRVDACRNDRRVPLSVGQPWQPRWGNTPPVPLLCHAAALAVLGGGAARCRLPQPCCRSSCHPRRECPRCVTEGVIVVGAVPMSPVSPDAALATGPGGVAPVLLLVGQPCQPCWGLIPPPPPCRPLCASHPSHAPALAVLGEGGVTAVPLLVGQPRQPHWGLTPPVPPLRATPAMHLLWPCWGWYHSCPSGG